MPIPSPEELRLLRIRAGLTQAELAERAGVSQSLIARIESGKVNPRVSTLVRIYQALEEFMEEELTACEVMSSPVVYVLPSASLLEVARLMWEKGFSQLPVLDDEGSENLGTVFDDDVLRAFIRENARASMLTAADVMSDPLPIVSCSTKVRSVARMLGRGLPAVLVEDEMKIVGIITKSDIAKLLLHSKPQQ
ncbi:MAG: CBS domain-containing protein [Thermofilum sp.]|jgi:predicted transcriptional regulator|uniref:CBS domain-containing protein n=1 Tax=Thermofilum sp. TaxID=1961369 RepID=UPI00258FE693|nr:CBS domain-containing protein [Thermofilum sp.]MCI4407479.1 CBS domain-containing protein [Thermofilum sp.]